MKNTFPWLTVMPGVVLLGGAWLLTDVSIAADNPDAEPVRERSWQRGGESRDGDRGAPGFRGREGRPVEQWLERLREEDPEEYERLQALRETDPMAFREELRERVRERRMIHQLRERHPRLHEFMREQPPQERRRMMRALSDLPDAMTDGGAPRHRRLPADPETRDLESGIRILVRDYRTESDPERQGEIREQIREKAVRLYDLREDRQRERVRALEERLDRLRENLEEHRATRDATIDAYVDERIGPVPE